MVNFTLWDFPNCLFCLLGHTVKYAKIFTFFTNHFSLSCTYTYHSKTSSFLLRFASGENKNMVNARQPHPSYSIAAAAKHTWMHSCTRPSLPPTSAHYPRRLSCTNFLCWSRDFTLDQWYPWIQCSILWIIRVYLKSMWFNQPSGLTSIRPRGPAQL